MARTPRVRISTAAPTVARRTRSPKHDFRTSQQLFEVRPLMIAPVLPGETLKSASFNFTTVSGLMYPIMSGFWQELYVFYVKHTDLDERELVKDMHVTNTTDASLLEAAAPIWGHTGGINWIKLATKRCVQEYFRNDGEGAFEYVSPDGLPLASYGRDDWLDSAILETTTAETQVDMLPDEILEAGLVETNQIPAGFEAHHDFWLNMKRQNMTQATFEDFLRSHGMSVPKEDQRPHRPELLRYSRKFQKPTRALDMGGEEACKLSWDVTESLDQDRLFKEPGFIVAFSVIRPKSFIWQAGNAASLMSDAFTWLPALLGDNPETSLRVIPVAQAGAMWPNYDGTDDVIVDMKDLFLYGDQYTAGEFAGVKTWSCSLPDDTFNRRYPSADDLSSWWFESSLATPPENYNLPPKAFVIEGQCRLSIASRVWKDTSGYSNQVAPNEDEGLT